jgi:tetratricopeptide (TPR) repeat protein
MEDFQYNSGRSQRNYIMDAEIKAAAVRYHQAGDFDRAADLYRQVLDADPSEANVWANLGDACLARGQTGDAISSYERAVALVPGHGGAQTGLGIAYAQQSRWDRAVSCFRKAVQARSDDAGAYNNLGVGLSSLLKLNEAELAFQQAIRIKPDHAEALSNLGLVQESLGKLPEAIASHEQALRIKPDFVAAYGNLQKTYAAQHELNRELTVFRMTHPYLTDDATVYHELGLALKAQGSKVAIASFQEALRLQPDSADILSNLGLTFQDRGHLAEAEASLRRALDLRPGDVVIMNNLGAVLEAAGRREEATDCFREAVRLNPDYGDAHYNLSVALCAAGKWTEGQEHYQRALELKQPDVEPTLADLYQAACTNRSDIYEHCPTLHYLAGQCRHITEMGTRTAVSTTALLFAQPEKLICYDRNRFPQVDRLARLAGRTEFIFRQADVRDIEIEPTDLLFIDTWHVYEQLKEELRLHADKVRKYIVLHDTTSFGQRGEGEGHMGIWPAVEEFLSLGTFRILWRYENNNGLTVLQRCAS